MYFALPVQLFSGVIGVILALMIRKSRLLLVVHSCLGLFSFLGMCGYKEFNQKLVIAHGYLTSVLALSLFIYQTIQQVFIQGSYFDIFLTLPFVIDFIVGAMSLYYIRQLWSDSQEISEIPEENSEFSSNLNERLIPGKECCVCKIRPSEILVYNCGHKCICTECSETIRRDNGKCPLCRKGIINLVRVYE